MIRAIWNKCKPSINKAVPWLCHPSSSPRDDVVVLVWAPATDKLTRETSTWATSLVLPEHVRSQRLIGHVLRKEIEESLTSMSACPDIAYFIGHGIDRALLGHPMFLAERKATASPIYDGDLLRFGPRSLFAFCCHAGRQLGREFAAKSGGAFLGYTERINIYVNEPCRKVWLGILQAIANVIIEERGITPGHKQKLHRALR